MKQTLTLYTVTVLHKETEEVVTEYDTRKMPSLRQLMAQYGEDFTIILNKDRKTFEMKTEDLIKYGEEV